MDNFKTGNIVDQLEDSLLRYMGSEAVENFTMKTNQHFHGRPLFKNATERMQIEAINTFWRNQLLVFSYDEQRSDLATEIRTWLENPGSIANYVDTFEKCWLPLIIKIGLFK